MLDGLLRSDERVRDQPVRVSRTRTSILLASVLALVAVACGGAEREASQPSEEQPSEEQPSEQSDEEPRYGGTLVAAIPDPGQLNPAITTSGITHPVTGQIFNGLVRLDSNFEPQPDLAKEWTVSADTKSYTLELERGVRWHDGEPFSSADVKFTFDEVLLQFSQRTRAALGPILESIETPDENTVVFNFKQPYPPFMSLVDEDNAPILPKHIYEGTDPFTNPANSSPIGTGPFQFDSEDEGDRITLVRNPDYFKEGQPYLDSLVFRLIANPVQAQQAFQAGEIDLLLYPIPPQVEQLESLPDVVVTEDGKEGFARVIRLIPNLRREPFDDVRVRQAISFAIDRDLIAETAYAGLFQPATGPISRGLEWAYSSDVAEYPYDPERAEALLDQAGLVPGANGIRFRTSFIFDQGFAPVADILKQQLGEVGIDLDLQLMEFNAWVDKLYLQWDFDLGYSQLTDAPDPDFAAKSLFTCDNIVKVPFVNAEGYCNKEVDSLFVQAATESDQTTRADLYAEIQRILVEEQPHIPLVDGIGPWAYSTEFRGIEDAGSKSPYYFGHTTWWTEGTAEPEG